MLEAMISGLHQTLGWYAFGLMLVGVIIGTINGITPGLGVNIGLALAIPFVFGMDPTMGFVLLLSLHSVGMTGGSIPAIMISVPGTGPNTATIFDGHPMAKKGEGGRAIGAAVMSSVLGGIIGAGILAGFIPILRPIVKALGSGEIFMLIIFGMTSIAMVSGEAMLKGLISGSLGLALGLVGLCPYSGAGRFTFGQLWLFDGINIMALVLGLFAIAEMIDLTARHTRIASDDAMDVKEATSFRQVLQGIKDAIRYWHLLIRSAIIGCFIGIIPGLGGEAAAFIVYGSAVQTCKDSENFGKGDVRGVISPEAANNAKEGGSLLPTVALGIPGSSGMAIMLGAFLVLGLVPGPEMLTKHLSVVWSMVWILVMANILAGILLIIFAKQVAKLAYLRPSLIIPLVILLAMMGSFMAAGQWENIVLSAFFGIVGYWMKISNYPRAPLVLGFILGHLAEKQLHQALGAWGPSFLLRPWTLVIMVMVVLSALYPVFQKYFAKRKQKENIG